MIGSWDLCSTNMLRSFTLVFVFVICVRENAVSVRISELRAPAHVAEGGQALLGCQFELGEDTLYSVKWYKDGQEFYHYVPLNDPPHLRFATSGVNVDLAQSSSDVVSLVNMTRHSAGLYRCEVSGETPLFTTVYEQKYISVHLLPESPPQLSGLRDEYQLGDRAILNCSSPPSRPETKLKWWINDRPVSRDHLQGPWYRIAMNRPDATETILQLRFTVMSKHFEDGVMKFKCQAMIAPLYHEETVYSLRRSAPEAVHTHEHELPQFGQITNSMPKRDTDLYEIPVDSAPRLRLSVIALVVNCMLQAAL